MRSITIFLAAAMTLVAMPFASANQAHPDCEAGQPLIGYRSTMFVKEILESQNNPGGLYVCEGEHWDGQDTVQPSQNPTCSGPSASAVPTDLFLGFCQGTDPNSAVDTDAGARVGSKNLNEAYIGLNIPLVGRAVVYSGPTMSGVYVRDNTPGNVLAFVVSAPRVTQGYVNENDCSQETYHDGAMNGNSQCGRDNTAITVQYNRLLP